MDFQKVNKIHMKRQVKSRSKPWFPRSRNGDFFSQQCILIQTRRSRWEGKRGVLRLPVRRSEELSLGLKTPSIRWIRRIYGTFSFVGLWREMSRLAPSPQLHLGQNCRWVRTAFESERPSSQNGRRVRTALESERKLSQNGRWLSHVIKCTKTSADANNTK